MASCTPSPTPRIEGVSATRPKGVMAVLGVTWGNLDRRTALAKRSGALYLGEALPSTLSPLTEMTGPDHAKEDAKTTGHSAPSGAGWASAPWGRYSHKAPQWWDP